MGAPTRGLRPRVSRAAPPGRWGFAGTGTTPGSFLCSGLYSWRLLRLAPSHTRASDSVTRPHGTPGPAPALHGPAGVPHSPTRDAAPERPAGLGGPEAAPASLEPSRGSRRGRAARPSLASAGLTGARGARPLAGGALGPGVVTGARRGSPGRGVRPLPAEP